MINNIELNEDAIKKLQEISELKLFFNEKKIINEFSKKEFKNYVNSNKINHLKNKIVEKNILLIIEDNFDVEEIISSEVF